MQFCPNKLNDYHLLVIRIIRKTWSVLWRFTQIPFLFQRPFIRRSILTYRLHHHSCVAGAWASCTTLGSQTGRKTTAKTVRRRLGHTGWRHRCYFPLAGTLEHVWNLCTPRHAGRGTSKHGSRRSAAVDCWVCKFSIWYNDDFGWRVHWWRGMHLGHTLSTGNVSYGRRSE